MHICEVNHLSSRRLLDEYVTHSIMDSLLNCFKGCLPVLWVPASLEVADHVNDFIDLEVGVHCRVYLLYTICLTSLYSCVVLVDLHITLLLFL